VTASAFRWLLVPELVLGTVGLVWAVFGAEPWPQYRLSGGVLLVASGFTAAFTVFNFGLFFAGRRYRFAPAVYAFLEEDIFPIVRRASLAELVLGASMAGLAEELFFRGVLQPRIGLVAASLVFGILHGPSRGLLPLAAWAAVAGCFLGLLHDATGNLALPTLVHALYDLVALLYVRYFWRVSKVDEPAGEI
jgi:hypothetical protein